MKSLPYVHGAIALMRDGFNERSGGSVILNPEGFPKIDYPWTEDLARGAKRALLGMAELQFAAGAKEVYPLHSGASPYRKWQDAKDALQQLEMKPPMLRVTSAHVMGGCGIGEGDQGVVNDRGEFKHLDNLTIADGSIFPTSIGTNPQLSIYGITHMFADHMIKKLKAD